MFDAMIYEVLREAWQVLVFGMVPIVVVLAIAGTLITALQSATSMQDLSTGYAVRLLALVAVLYFLYGPFTRSVATLARLAWKGS